MFSALAPYLLLIKIAAVIVLALSTGLTGFQLGSKLTQAKVDAAQVARKAGEDAALKAAAAAIAKIEVKHEQVIQPLRTEIRTNTVYRDCKHGPDSLRNLNALITGTESLGDLSMPGTKPPRR